MPNVVTTSAETVSNPTGAETPADALGVTKRMNSSDEASNESDDVECPTCNRGFSSTHSMRIHHTKAHEDPIRITKRCEQCGSEFDVWPCKSDQKYCSTDCQHDAARERVVLECVSCSDPFETVPSEADRRRTCSKECEAEWKSTNLTGADAAGWQGGPITIKCDYCGTETEKKPHKLDDHENLFCSVNCRAEWVSEEQQKEDHPRWKGGRTTAECDECGSNKKVKRHVLEDNERIFCDFDCYSQWQSKHRSGENSQTWKGGWEGYYGPSWQPQRRRTLERDGRKCRVCGLLDSEHHDQHGQGLHVHHIRPFREFGKDRHEEANALENLITLCRSCHRRWEGIPLQPQLID